MGALKCYDFKDVFLCAAESEQHALEIHLGENGEEPDERWKPEPIELSEETMKAMPAYLDMDILVEGTVWDLFTHKKEAGVFCYHDV